MAGQCPMNTFVALLYINVYIRIYNVLNSITYKSRFLTRFNPLKPKLV
jgi:hypothetical protein